MKLSDLGAVSALSAQLRQLEKASAAVTNGSFRMTAHLDGYGYDIHEIVSKDVLRLSVAEVFKPQIALLKGQLRELGVDLEEGVAA